MKRRVLAAAFLGAASTGLFDARAEEPDMLDFLADWSLGGSLHLSGERRGGGGDPAGQIFGPEATDGFAELDLRANRAFSRFHTWDISLFASFDDSETRGVKDGFLLERFRAVGQRGDVDTPWRLEFGDYFGFLSERSLQSPLKGGRIELQPEFGDSETFHSVQLFGGNVVRDYNDFFAKEGDDEAHFGGSWLMERQGLGALLFSGVYSAVEGPVADGATFSLAGETGFELAGQSLTFESEIAWFDGDAENATGKDDGLALMAALAGQSDGWRYSGRFEDYSAGFAPPGSAIIQDQRFYEGRFGYLFDDGAQVEGRYQHQEVQRALATELATETFGVFATLPASASTYGTGLTLDIFRRDETSRDGATDRISHNAFLNATRALDEAWTATLGLEAALTENAGVLVTEDVQFAGVEFDATRAIALAGFQGSFTPGFRLQVEETGNDSVYGYGPQLGVFLAGGGHGLSARVDLLFQDTDAGLIDAAEASLGLTYDYTFGQNRIGVEADYFSRDPEVGRFGDGYRVLVSFTHSFDRPARTQPGGAGFAGGGDPFVQTGFVDLTAFQPGMALADAQAEIETAGRSALFRFGPALVGEDRWLREIDTRQRLALVGGLGRLERAGLIVDLPAGNGGAADARAFERIKELFLKTYGPPSVAIETGDFGPDIAGRSRDGSFRRVYEWPGANGVLRLGIPARLDGAVRVEAIHARTQPPPGQATWGFQEIR